jgi:hypothetical protein
MRLNKCWWRLKQCHLKVKQFYQIGEVRPTDWKVP